ncbi:MAG TPA: choice-of-anchor Q domain-containing protein [bacterium]|nr:choice-of-anchor Q domain-containing protein [bacterium]
MKKNLLLILLSVLFFSCEDNSTTKELGFVDLDENNDFDWAVEESDETFDSDMSDESDESDETFDSDMSDEVLTELDDESDDSDQSDESDESDETFDSDQSDESDESDESDQSDESEMSDQSDEDFNDEDFNDEDQFIPENVIFVKHDATGLNDGTSWENGYTDLSVAIRFLIENHIEGKDIWVAKGTYHPTDCPNHYSECNFETPQRRYHFTLLKGVGIYGGFTGTETDIFQRDWANNETILSGDFNNDDETTGNSENAYHVFYHDGWERKDNTAILDGFTITGGNANGDNWPDQDGGGIRNNKWTEFGSTHTAPVIRNCIFRNNNSLLVGGAMYNHEGASPVIENCTFAGNTANKGGAIYNYLGAPVISNCTFVGNLTTTVGGAVVIDSSAVTISDSVLDSNSSGQAGGAVFIRGSETPLIKSTLFKNNTSLNAGAVANHEADNVVFENCYFYNNSATGSALPSGLGGALQNNEGSNVTVINSVFKGNSAVAGGAVLNIKSDISVINCSISGNNANGAIGNGESNPEIVNTIIYANTGGSFFNIPEGTYGMAASIPVVSYSDIEGCGGSAMTCGTGTETCWIADCGTDNGNNIAEDPLFINSGDEPLNLTDLSPCVDAGDSTKIPVTVTKDIAGNDRIQGVAIEMGAYEVK